MLGLRLWHALDGWWGIVIALSAYGLMIGVERIHDLPAPHRFGVALLWALMMSGLMVLGLLVYLLTGRAGPVSKSCLYAA